MTSERGNGNTIERKRSTIGWNPLGHPKRSHGKIEEWTERYDSSPPADGGLESAVQKMDAVADKYENDGWATYRCHPGGVDLVATDDDRIGIEIVIPDNELDEVEDLLTDGTFESYQVYRTEFERLLFFVVAVEDSAEQTVLLFAGYFDLDEAAPIFDRADRDGEFGIYLRTPGGDYVEFAPFEPAYFRPADATAGESEEADSSPDG